MNGMVTRTENEESVRPNPVLGIRRADGTPPSLLHPSVGSQKSFYGMGVSQIRFLL